MSESRQIVAQQIELLHVYHLDLWTEVEAQLRVLRKAQEEVAKLRDARTANESPEVALGSAKALKGLVQTLKGRVGTLGATIGELDGTVDELIRVLS